MSEGSVGPGDTDSCEPSDDTDCDGTPNEGCFCVDGETQPCGSNTNLGPCQIGTSTCVDGRFGPCVGAVAPASADSCSSRNDDSNCNGIPFDSCSCVNGETQACGMTDTGVCERGTRTCVNGAFGQCVGAVNPRSRDCRSPQDNDCDGRSDNIVDNVCRCSIGSTQACDTHPGLDGNGRCRAGTQICVAGMGNSSSNFGACSGSVGPIARDCASQQDNDCDGLPDNSQCPCQGCAIGNACVAAGTTNPANQCEVCDPQRNRSQYSPSQSADCSRPNGATCTSANQCASRQCVVHYGDGDGDGFALQSAINAAESFCVMDGFVVDRFTRTRPSSPGVTDCLDTNANVRPNQIQFFTAPVLGLNPAFDYNCDGIESDSVNNRLVNCLDSSIPNCTEREGWNNFLPACGAIETGTGSIGTCQLNQGLQCVPGPGGPANRACH